MPEHPFSCDQCLDRGLLAIARIVAPHGVYGELRANILTDFPERFERLTEAILGDETSPRSVSEARVQGSVVLLRVEGCDSREQAEELRGALVQVPLSDASALSEDQYYWHDLIGCQVWTEEGRDLGVLTEILESPANDVFVVKKDDKEILLPVIEEVVRQVDVSKRTMTVHLLPGLEDI